ncbi:DUF1036 domain-containing protein [uncultured Microscilla sp.]|uniref:DUF1036 domain-containing protein n=1 Tax=uncultured Microscilla sp. TaxID=432653 RepID=UPI002627EDD0|nr:DUF1036 domain-containing protein [uncultured Microscilla sp.]
MKTKKTLFLLLFFSWAVFAAQAQKKGGKIMQQTTSGSLKGKTYKVTFKNKSEKDMYVAVAYYDNDPRTMGGRCFYSKGWYKVKQGKSIWLNVSGKKFYYHAHQVGKNDVSYGSEKEFYVHPIKAFNIRRAAVGRYKREGDKYSKYKFDKIPESRMITIK